jgi:hypothetical protein
MLIDPTLLKDRSEPQRGGIVPLPRPCAAPPRLDRRLKKTVSQPQRGLAYRPGLQPPKDLLVFSFFFGLAAVMLHLSPSDRNE